MCSHYRVLKQLDALNRQFGLDLGVFDLPRDLWPTYSAPFIRRADAAEHQREAALGRFGLLPHWTRDERLGRQTYNARSETAATKPSFRDAWRRGRRCIIPATSFFEPSWETGKAVPWEITAADGSPVGIAGLWDRWRSPAGEEVLSFAMLTVNADGHPLMQRFHRPADEKRMVVILDPADYDRWLDAPQADMPAFMTRYPAELLQARPDLSPRPTRSRPAA